MEFKYRGFAPSTCGRMKMKTTNLSQRGQGHTASVTLDCLPGATPAPIAVMKDTRKKFIPEIAQSDMMYTQQQ